MDDEFKISYRCESCDRLFPKKHDLEWHLREHTGVRPLPCGLCPMKFLNGRLLAAHHTRHHGLGSKQILDKYDLRSSRNAAGTMFFLEEYAEKSR
ncbi:hypothetical protein MTO96_040456 [Rhipicephalus appendiculatus]